MTDGDADVFLNSRYDQDKSGTIEKSEIFRLLERGTNQSQSTLTAEQAHMTLVEHGLGDLDMDGDGVITKEDFMRAATHDSTLLQVFGQCL